VLSSALIDQLAEYSVPGQTIGHGSFIGTVTITQPTLSHSVTDAAIQTTLQQQIKGNSSLPKPDADTLYFIYLPPGTAVVQVDLVPARRSAAITTPSEAAFTTP
jgi:hypothetical protein